MMFDIVKAENGYVLTLGNKRLICKNHLDMSRKIMMLLDLAVEKNGTKDTEEKK